MISITLVGAKELERKLSTLEKKTAKKIIRKAVRAGTKIIHNAVKENALSMVGGKMGSLLKKNVIVRAWKKQRRGGYGVGVSLRKDVPEFVSISAAGKKSYIPAAIEYGHDNAAALPFMRKAYDAHGEKAKQTTMNEIDKGVKLTFGK